MSEKSEVKENINIPNLSQEYINFLLEERKSKELKTFYEKFCKFFEIFGITAPKKIYEKLQRDIVFSTINVTPTGVFSASVLSLIFTGLIIFLLSFIFQSTSLIILSLILSIVTFFYIYSYPGFNAQILKIQTGDEAIKIILYMVIYLKLNPSFEGSVVYAISHTKGPITTDIKKAIWDLQTGKYKTIEEALSVYMPKWVIWNEDFVRSLSLLYGVLIEPSEEGRDNILKKSLDFFLVNTQRRMKNYVENITGAINILHILGILLPVMGLIMFPLISMFLHESVNPLYIGIGYTIFLPLFLYFLSNRILLKRPSAFIIPDISKHPDLPPEKTFVVNVGNRKIFVPILPLVIIVGLLVMTYGILHFGTLYGKFYSLSIDAREELMKEEAKITFENILSTLSITGGIGLAVFLYFYLNSFQRIKIRNDIKNIENEFQVGLFSLGNYLSEGYPIEKSIEKSIDEYEKLGMEKKPTYFFFSKLLQNIKNSGMTFKRAIFDKTKGIIIYFPSVLIEEVMQVLSSASEKSSTLLGKVAKIIGSYIEDLNIIEAKIRELLEDVRSGLRMQGGFVIPLVCGIVASLGIFILNMFMLVSCELEKVEKSFGFDIFGDTSSIINELIGKFSQVMPMTLLQVIIGIYTIEIVIIVSILLNGIENGFDNTSRDYIIADTLKRAILFYFITNIISLFIFNQIIISIISTGRSTFTCV